MTNYSYQNSDVTVEPEKAVQDSARAHTTGAAVQISPLSGDLYKAIMSLHYHAETKSSEQDQLAACFRLCRSQMFNQTFLADMVKITAAAVKASASARAPETEDALQDWAPCLNWQDVKKALCEFLNLHHGDPLYSLVNNAFDAQIHGAEFAPQFSFIVDDGTGRDPLSQSELKKWLLDHFKISRLNGQFAFWNGNGYKQGEDLLAELLEMAFKIAGISRSAKWKKDFIAGIVPSLDLKEADPRFIPLKDCVLELDPEDPRIETCKIHPYHPDLVVTNPLNVTFRPDVYNKAMDDALTAWAGNDPESRAALEECLGVLISPDLVFKKGVFWHGEKDAGKSTCAKCLEALIGDGNYSILTPKNLGDKYKIAEIASKRANVGDDISGDPISGAQAENLKKCISGEGIETEKKYGDPKRTHCRGKWLLIANDWPPIYDRALKERLVYFEFRGKFKPTDMRAALTSDEALEYMLICALQGLFRVYQRVNAKDPLFTDCEAVRIATDAMNAVSDPVWDCFHDRVEGDFTPLLYDRDCTVLSERTTQHLYDDIYKPYCVENSQEPLTKRKMQDLLLAMLRPNHIALASNVRYDGKNNGSFFVQTRDLEFLKAKYPGIKIKR